MNIERIDLEHITGSIQVRSIKPAGVERIKAKIEAYGYRSEKPVILIPNGTGYKTVDGAHRVEVCRQLGLATIPAIVRTDLLTEEQCIAEYRILQDITACHTHQKEL